MKTLKLTSEQLRYKMKNLDALLPNRSVCNDEQLYDLYSKFRDLIEELDYKVDIADCISALHDSFEDLEMYE